MLALDFARYAPEKPYGFEELEAQPTADPEPESAAMPEQEYEPLKVREALLLLAEAVFALLNRAMRRSRNAISTFSRSLFCAWATAGFGWGAALCFGGLAAVLWK